MQAFVVPEKVLIEINRQLFRFFVAEGLQLKSIWKS